MRDVVLHHLHVAGVDLDDKHEASASTSSVYCTSRRQKAGKAASERAKEQATRGVKFAPCGGEALSHGDLAAQHIGEHVRAGLKTLSSGSNAAVPGPAAEAAEVEVAPGVVFEHLAPADFARFRAMLGVSEAEYDASMSSMSGGITQDSGKSGSLFWFSGDQRFILKSITALEMKSLLDILPRYIAHFEESKQSGVPCLLSRFFAAYRIKAGKASVWLVAMNNVFEGVHPERVYDLKGTTEDRYVKPSPGKVMKDLNFQGRSVNIPPTLAHQISAAVERDAGFLRGEKIMDYSFLVGFLDEEESAGPGAAATKAAMVLQGTEVVEGGAEAPLKKPARAAGTLGVLCGGKDDESGSDEVDEHPAVMRVGIIDVLVRWTAVKIAAHVMKKPTIGCFNEIDTEPPEYYQDRFVHYVTSKFAEDPASDSDDESGDE